MKKVLLIMTYVLLTINLHAQDKGTMDVGIFVGTLTTNELVNIASDVIVSGVSAGNVTYTGGQTTPAISIYAKRAVLNNWFIYGDASYQTIKEHVMINNTDNGIVRNSFFTLGLGTEYHYIHKDWFQMYSGASIGYTWQHSDYTGSSPDIQDNRDSYVNFQVNALGFRFGKELAGIIELGAGYKGIACLGLSYQF